MRWKLILYAYETVTLQRETVRMNNAEWTAAAAADIARR